MNNNSKKLKFRANKRNSKMMKISMGKESLQKFNTLLYRQTQIVLNSF